MSEPVWINGTWFLLCDAASMVYVVIMYLSVCECVWLSHAYPFYRNFDFSRCAKCVHI